jgi:hypothetical protein
MPVSTPSGSDNQKYMAIASLVIGILNLCAWFLPICGAPMGIVGIVLGIFGMKSPSQKTLAIVGIVLSSIGLLLACGNAVAGILFNSGDIFRQIQQGLGQ